MLSPEVWNFNPPQHHFSVERRNCDEKDVPGVVKTHYFNHSVSVVLPDTIRVPDSLRSCVSEDSDYYRVDALNVYDLLSKEFIEAFVAKGELNVLAVENRIDLDSSISITPSGYLILSLIQDDFQKLGLEGKASSFDRKTHTRYVVTIDLKKEYFTPGKKNYEHTRAALEKRFDKKFNVIVAWDPPEEKVCPSSIAAWFHKHGYKVSICRQTFFQRTQYSLQVPIISNECDIEAFLEWLGVFSISGDLSNGNEDNYVNTYQCPSPFLQVGQVQYLQWSGFFTRKKVAKVYSAMKEYVLLKDTLPWCALHVQGFADSVISWDLKEHTFFMDGDNSYTAIFQPSAKTMIRKSLSSNNKPRIFQ